MNHWCRPLVHLLLVEVLQAEKPVSVSYLSVMDHRLIQRYGQSFLTSKVTSVCTSEVWNCPRLKAVLINNGIVVWNFGNDQLILFTLVWLIISDRHAYRRKCQACACGCECMCYQVWWFIQIFLFIFPGILIYLKTAKHI